MAKVSSKNIILPRQKEDTITIDAASPQATALPCGTRKPPGSYTYGSHDNENNITGTSRGKVLGTGRETNFTDTYGENGSSLFVVEC
ncbi:hypothetical protein [Paenibacillus medicaginis]|uniref:Uncharacterized protein n=1 Tax=Paenibacillus medicaginis TaxID=1470560 RepID=A0ABV5BVE6_9BACL